ncbi:hypothetical protein ACFUIW_09710 [Streptomyces sp. NPDC057245]|uniref:hypothetical protein n=1 Tax=Streptomyces sp. NPDC057245 TaxID=3346065 RepID=UPI00363A389D
MASQNQPDSAGQDPAGGPSVRRAVSLGAAATDPGPMLAPAAERTAAPAPGGAGTGESGTARPDTAGSGAAPERPATAGDTTAGTAAGASPTASASAATTATASAATTTATTTGRSEAEGEATAQPATAQPATAVRAAPDGGAAGAAGAGADEPPSGKPRKPLLAAAGITGIVLLAVPLLIWATDNTREKKDNAAVAARSDTLLDDAPLEAPNGQYAPAEPTTEPPSSKPPADPGPSKKRDAEPPSSAPAEKAPTTSAPAEKPQTKKKLVAREARKARILSPSTAAGAVERLGSGRHVCYRVHLKGSGWTAPVCDGATAGKPDGGQPITAVNIAVTGAQRVNANEFIQHDGYTTDWAGADDKSDLTLGTASNSAPNLGGFAIGVESGQICQNNKLGGHGWPNGGCAADGGWVFAGSTEGPRWLEAIKLTV